MSQLQKPDMVCLQESKLEHVDRKLCLCLWEDDDFDWLAKDAEGRSGGLIVLWKMGSFELDSIFQGGSFLGLVGF